MACLALWSVTDGFTGNFYWKSDVGEIKTPANSLPNAFTVKLKENKSLTGKKFLSSHKVCYVCNLRV